jgi:hypothetical protein
MQEAGSVGGHVTGHVTEPISDEHDWAVSAGALTYKGRVYVPEGLRSKVTALHHDNPESGLHVTTRLTPFFANYGYHPEMHFKMPNEAPEARFRSEKAADERLGRLQTARDRLRESILEAQARQTRYAGGKEMVFEVGNKVWLSAKHIQTARPSKKLDYERLGPFKITKVINRNAYRLELPNSMKIQNVFHVSLLDRYASQSPGSNPASHSQRYLPRTQTKKNRR